MVKLFLNTTIQNQGCDRLFPNKKGKTKQQPSKSLAQRPKDKSSYSTIIGKGVSLEGGTIKGVGNICVNGYFVGDVNIEGQIIINDSGAVYGDIRADKAIIAGNCKGNTITAASMHLTSTAVVESTLLSNSITIDEGAAFNGLCEMETVVQLPFSDTNTTVASEESHSNS